MGERDEKLWERFKKKSDFSMEGKKMVSKKKNVVYVLVSAVFVVVLVSGVVSANHAWWHFWGEEEPELAPFDASVQLGNAAPTIVAFRPADDFNTDGTAGPASGIGEVGAVANTEIWAKVTFIVEDSDQPNDLPGIGTGDAIVVGDLSGTSNIRLDLTSPSDVAGADQSVRCAAGTCRVRSASSGTTAGTDYPSGLSLSRSCVATTCAGGTNSNCNAATVAAGDGTDFNLQVQYDCYVKLNYWDEPTVTDVANPPQALDDYWTITAGIEDSSGTSDTVSSGTTNWKGVASYDFDGIACTGIGNCDVINHLSVKALAVAGPIAWTAVALGTGNDPADGASDLALGNRGNEGVASVSVAGQDLQGVGAGGVADSTSRLRIGAFSVNEVTNEAASPPTECSATSQYLSDAGPVTVTGVNVPFSAGGGSDSGTADVDNTYFCIREVLSGSTCTVGGTASQPCSVSTIYGSYRAADDSTNGFANSWDLTAA